MGYCITLTDNRLLITHAKQASALEAVKQLMTRTDLMTGGSNRGDRWFAWVNDNSIMEATELGEALLDWRYEPEYDDEGRDIVRVELLGEKIGDEVHLWRVIAPYVEDGSFLDYIGEDDERWRWEFVGGKLYERNGINVWSDPTPVLEA
jgi:hypothetical protein